MEKKKLLESNNTAMVRVRFLDKHVEELYEELKKLPEYSKAVSPVFNDAIRLGIPKLYNEIFGEVKIDDDKIPSKIYDRPIEEDVLLERIIDLLQEVNTNILLTKAATFSLFNLYKNILNNKVLKDKFNEGELSDTPEFLKDYEDFITSEMDEG